MKLRLYIILLFTFIAPLITAQVPDTLKYIVLSSADFFCDYKSSNNAVIIDVRKNKDYRKSRIEGAINIEHPVPEEYFSTPGAIDIRSSLFIYCYAGYSSRKAAVIFYNHGYRNIYSLEGGFMKWKSKKMPVEKKKAGGRVQGAGSEEQGARSMGLGASTNTESSLPPALRPLRPLCYFTPNPPGGAKKIFRIPHTSHPIPNTPHPFN